MGMFCYQCQETAKNTGCTIKGVCGKDEKTAQLHDLMIYILRGISMFGEKAAQKGDSVIIEGRFITKALFATITNANFDAAVFERLIREGLRVRDDIAARYGKDAGSSLHDAAVWHPGSDGDLMGKAFEVGVLSTENEDQRSLRELLVIGLKGIAAYAHHAEVLGHEDEKIYAFIMEALASTTKELSVDDMVAMVMKSGDIAVETMALLDKANTTTYGNPEITKVNIGVRSNPGILISGHDLKDLDELLKQT